MSNYRINTNYAKALLMLASEMEQDAVVLGEMRLIEKVCAENRELCVVLANPTLKSAKKAAIIRELFMGKVSDLTMTFLGFVVRQNRSVNLRGISQSYINQYRKAHGIMFCEVTTAVEMDDKSLDMLRDMVAEYTHLQVEQENHVDHRMLGGFRLTFDNNMYDARLRTKIRRLQQEFEKNTYESKL